MDLVSCSKSTATAFNQLLRVEPQLQLFYYNCRLLPRAAVTCSTSSGPAAQDICSINDFQMCLLWINMAKCTLRYFLEILLYDGKTQQGVDNNSVDKVDDHAVRQKRRQHWQRVFKQHVNTFSDITFLLKLTVRWFCYNFQLLHQSSMEIALKRKYAVPHSGNNASFVTFPSHNGHITGNVSPVLNWENIFLLDGLRFRSALLPNFEHNLYLI